LSLNRDVPVTSGSGTSRHFAAPPNLVAIGE
jgi:hypothetical protein